MKKIMQVSLAVTLAITTSVLMSACASSASSKASSMESSSSAISSSVSSDAAISSEEPVSSEAAVSSEVAPSKAESKAAFLPSLKEFVKMPVMQTTIKTLTDSMAKEGIKFDLSTDGNKIIYSYTYPSTVKLDAKKMNSQLEQQASTFQNLATTLKQSVSEENLVVVVRYLDSNKKVIVSKEFSAK